MLEADDQKYGISRLVAFCDGIFGFAITLLITTIPFSLGNLVSSATNEQVIAALGILLPSFYAYVLSFYIVGNYWVVHHRIFRQIIKYDSVLLWLNLTLLLFIVFLPVPTALLGRYGNNSLITALYALTNAIIASLFLVMEWYACFHHRLIPPSVDEKMIRYGYMRALIPIGIFVLSIGLAFLNPQLAKLSWIAIFLIRPIVLRGRDHKSHKQSQQ
jgi:uncharacterized membrane protein